MEKLKFALQVAVLVFAFPVYFYAEVNHGKKSRQKESTTIVKTVNCYTKNGKDKTGMLTIQQSVFTNTIFLNNIN